MGEDILARIEALEARVDEFAPAIQRRPFKHHPAPWVRNMIVAKVNERRASNPMSHPILATINVEGEVNDVMAQRVSDQLSAAHFAQEIEVIIDTAGGEFDAAMRIYRGIVWNNARVKTARLGHKCQSAGVLIMAACEHRIARPETSIVAHGSGDRPDPSEHWSARRHIQAIRDITARDAEMLNVIADGTGIDLPTLVALISDEEPTSVEMALHIGLITGIAP